MIRTIIEICIEKAANLTKGKETHKLVNTEMSFSMKISSSREDILSKPRGIAVLVKDHYLRHGETDQVARKTLD